MKPLELYYPVKPHTVNRSWGFVDPIYKQFGFNRHNGVDLALVNGQEIHAPFAGTIINIGNDPSGSGIFVSIVSDCEYSFPDGKVAYVLLDFFHCQKIIVNIGDTVELGQVLALGDNTGVTTGAHTHMQPRREFLAQLPDSVTVHAYRIRNINYGFTDVDTNDANNTFDPEVFWNHKYACDYNPTQVSKLKIIIQNLTSVMNSLLSKLASKKSKTT